MKSTSRKTIIFHILGITLLLISLVAFTGLISGMSSIFADDGGAAVADSGGGDAGGGDTGGAADAGDSGGAADSGGDAADSGSDAADSGGEAADSGGEAADSGDEAADAGGEAADSGDEAADSGDEAADSGDEAADSGDEAAADEGEADSADAADEDAAGDEAVAGEAAVTTDQSDYAATEAPVITVSYLAPNSPVDITITAPDGMVTEMTTTTDDTGNTIISYAPEGGLQNGEYTVVATDGATTVTTMFTDAVSYSLYQWANTSSNWTNGDLNNGNSNYAGGDVVPFMLVIDDFGTSDSRSITITYDYSRFNAMLGTQVGAYDSLVAYNAAGAPTVTLPSLPNYSGDYYDGHWAWSDFFYYSYCDYNDMSLSSSSPSSPSSGSDKTQSVDITLSQNHSADTWMSTYVLWGGHLSTNVSEITGGPLEMDTNKTGDCQGNGLELELGAIAGWEEIRLYKSGPDFAHVDDTITYTFTIFNAGENDYNENDIQIVDALGFTIPGSYPGQNTFNPGDIWTYTHDYTVLGTDTDPLVNNAEVQIEECVGYHYEDVYHPGYKDHCGHWHPGYTTSEKVYDYEFVTRDSDSWSVDILHPGIEIVKTGPETATEGDTIEYTFTVTNTSDDTPLNGVAIIDSLEPAAVYISGDTNLDGWLDPGEAWMFTATYDIPLGTVGDMLNTAIASGTDILGGDKGYVEDDSTWTVAVTALTTIATGGEYAESPLFLVIDVEGNVARYPVTPEGALRVDVIQTSPDGNLVLEIPMGTIVRNPDGSAAYLNADPDVIGIQAGAVAGTGDATVIQAYDLTPEGVYFDNGQATLTAKYNADAVPAGKSLSWAYYDANSGNWVDILTSGTVAAGGEPAAAFNTSSLALFALLAR